MEDQANGTSSSRTDKCAIIDIIPKLSNSIDDPEKHSMTHYRKQSRRSRELLKEQKNILLTQREFSS